MAVVETNASALDAIERLHQMLVDSKIGYDEAFKVSQGGDLSGLFRQMVVMRERDLAELAQLLTAAGRKTDDAGSFMSTVHKTVIDLRSMFTGLDVNSVGAFADGEELILKQYDETIAELHEPALELAPLLRQQENLRDRVSHMRNLAETV